MPTDPISLAREAIALAEKATASPWTADTRARFLAVYQGEKVNCIDEADDVIYTRGGQGGEIPESMEHDARFIAFSRTALPALAREVLDLTERVEKWRAGFGWLDGHGCITGDCPHRTIDECYHSLADTIKAACAALAPRSPAPAPDPLKALVSAQAEDAGLWFEATTAPEAYLQQELRKLHAAIERRTAP